MENEIIKTIKKHKNTIITIIVAVLILIAILIYLKKQKNEEISIEPIIEEVVTEKTEEIKVEPQVKKLKIDIKGEVNNPGVYELNEGDRVIEAINISGGLTDNADTSLINLSKNLKDEMVIIIYDKDLMQELNKEEIKTETVIKYIEKECTCPDVINDACINKEEKNETDINEEEKEVKNEKVSINNATIEELTTIPGIGETKAEAIIEYREENGLFKSIEEIMNIKGIGESTFEKLKNYITI